MKLTGQSSTPMPLANYLQGYLNHKDYLSKSPALLMLIMLENLLLGNHNQVF